MLILAPRQPTGPSGQTGRSVAPSVQWSMVSRKDSFDKRKLNSSAPFCAQISFRKLLENQYMRFKNIKIIKMKKVNKCENVAA